jgi:hypothetical protein
MSHKLGRSIQVRGMAYAPVSEQGVVFLFGRLAPQLGFHVESVQVHCPDCVATYRGRRVRIEFEFWASHFAVHRHDAKQVDMIVCWENDWAARPKKYKKLEIFELKPHVDALPRVFVVGCSTSENIRDLNTRKKLEWNVPESTQKGDLVLIYRTQKFGGAIFDLWEVGRSFARYAPGNRHGRKPGLQAELRLLMRLKRPLTYRELASHPLTRGLGVVRKRFIGKTEVTDDWHAIYGRIIRKNPNARKLLRDCITE